MHSISVSKPHEYCVNCSSFAMKSLIWDWQASYVIITWFAHHFQGCKWWENHVIFMWIAHHFHQRMKLVSKLHENHMVCTLIIKQPEGGYRKWWALLTIFPLEINQKPYKLPNIPLFCIRKWWAKFAHHLLTIFQCKLCWFLLGCW